MLSCGALPSPNQKEKFNLIKNRAAMKKLIGLFASLVLSLFAFVGVVQAQEVVVEVSGNGTSSENQVNYTVSQETNVSSTNQSNIQNDVNSQANTGSNQASSNTGSQTDVTTGDVSQSVSIENQANSSTVNLSGCGCEGQGVDIQNSGNGSDSNNNISANVQNNTSINVENYTSVTNIANVHANSGSNSANGNTGDVSLYTGNIAVSGSIQNRVNLIEIFVDPRTGNQELRIINSSNGTNSTNFINLSILNDLNISTINEETISNLVDIFATTGGNSANDNTGSVYVGTGDIDVAFGISNEGNESIVSVGKDCPFDPGQPQPQPGAPSPSQGGPSGSVGSSGVGASIPAVLAAQLPATGPEHLILLLLFWFAILSAGIALRRLGQRGPPSFILVR